MTQCGCVPVRPDSLGLGTTEVRPVLYQDALLGRTSRGIRGEGLRGCCVIKSVAPNSSGSAIHPARDSLVLSGSYTPISPTRSELVGQGPMIPLACVSSRRIVNPRVK